MSGLNLVGIALGLAMDALAVSVAVGLTLGTVTPRQVFRLAFHFGLFQFLMPIVGWTAGSTVAEYIAACDHWLAAGLLGLVGGKMVSEALSGQRRAARSDPTRGWTLLALSLATSIDALAVGLSLAFLRIAILLPSAVIGLVCAALTAGGITFAGRLGQRWARGAEALGGLVLLVIGARVLVMHLG